MAEKLDQNENLIINVLKKSALPPATLTEHLKGEGWSALQSRDVIGSLLDKGLVQFNWDQELAVK
ncbi:MAG: hypothetical protein IH865_01945 [Chloroflexi bacterium]|nr:hypothetical protein [Chloroflexota bacterium]